VTLRGAGIRMRLALVAAAIAAAAGAVLLAAGLPLAARGALSPRAFLVLAAASTLFAFLAGAAALWRSVARPVDRLLAAAERLAAGSPGELPLLGEPGGLALERAAVAFERVAAALEAERARLAGKVEELTAANRALAEARESLLRSEKLATMGRLAAGVAHEVGNPLGAVAGYGELARARIAAGRPDQADDLLARAAAEAQRIDRTVRDLLDFARPSAPALVAVDLAGALEGSLRLARMQARFRDVAVTVDLQARLPPVVADERTLAQVVLNLLLNAGDAMGGRGALSIAARAADGRVLVRFTDHGSGIAPEDLPRIFDPFFTTKDPGKGTGLGLAICHRIMESFGGEIAVESAPGGGAAFTLTFRDAAAIRPEPEHP
jgi:two-component system, NtrC family, sensor kinase